MRGVRDSFLLTVLPIASKLFTDEMKLFGVYVDESIKLISHKCRSDTKAVTAHLTHWYPTIHFLDNILWFGLHFSLARRVRV